MKISDSLFRSMDSYSISEKKTVKNLKNLNKFRELIVHCLKSYELDSKREKLLLSKLEKCNEVFDRKSVQLFLKIKGGKPLKKEVGFGNQSAIDTMKKVYRLIDYGIPRNLLDQVDELMFEEEHLYARAKYFGGVFNEKSGLELPLIEITPFGEDIDDIEDLKNEFEDLKEEAQEIEIFDPSSNERFKRVKVGELKFEEFKALVWNKESQKVKRGISVIEKNSNLNIFNLKDLLQSKPNEKELKKVYEKFLFHEGALTDLNNIREINITDLSFSEFRKMILNEEGSIKPNYTMKYFTTYHSWEDLEEQDIFHRDENNKLYLDENYSFLEEGVINIPPTGWDHIRPFKKVDPPPEKPTVEIILHSKKGRYSSVFNDQGHASIMITDTAGNVFSVGLFGVDFERDSKDLSMQRGVLQSPDAYLFLPSKSFDEQRLKYEVSDEGLKKTLNWIDAVNGHSEVSETDTDESEIESSNVLFQPTHQNCAFFAKEVQNLILEDKESRLISAPKVKRVKKFQFKIKKLFLQNLLKISLFQKKLKINEGVDYEGLNLNIKSLSLDEMLLPMDLLYQKKPL